ncbi:MAG: hypothetical protein RSE41_03935 [Clostridia bacterium]
MRGALRLNDEARAKRNAYMKEWRKKNKEKVQEYQNKYWERKVSDEERK